MMTAPAKHNSRRHWSSDICIRNFPQSAFFQEKSCFLLIIPLVIEQFLAIAVGFADTIMVSYVGENSVSGVSLVDSINILVIQIFSALATGGAVVAAQYIGRSETNNACRSAKQLLNASIVLSGALMAICLCFRKFILSTVFGKNRTGGYGGCRKLLSYNQYLLPLSCDF